ncbi:MAG: 4-hydroxymandelate oxidase [Verrucomicrobiales bacterium]|jgi:4-hydroxymandelate oxidase
MTLEGSAEAGQPPGLSRAAFDFLDGGAGDEITLRANESAFRRWSLVPRVCVDVAKVDVGAELDGRRVGVPYFVAPTGAHRLFHPDAEFATAAAARAADVPYATSTAASVSMEEIAKVAPAERWFQLYCFKDRGVVADMVRRAESSGYRALIITVDAPVLGIRRRDIRNRFSVGPEIRWANLEPYGVDALSDTDDGSTVARYFAEQIDPSVTWLDIERIVASTSLPVWVKGVLRPDDAERARDSGASGVYVSNHGGRQLDRVPPTIDVLSSIVDRVGADIDVVVDGGVRSGADVVTAIALGARAVGLGRPPLTALASGGESAVVEFLRSLHSDLVHTLQLLGVPSLQDLNRSFLSPTTGHQPEDVTS